MVVPRGAALVHSVESLLLIRQRAAAGPAVVLGIGFLILAWMMNEQWLNAHFPPDYFPPYNWIENGIHLVRLVLAVSGLCAILAGRTAGSLLKRSMTRKWIAPTAMSVLAVILALTAAEFILRSSGWQTVNSGDMQREPLRLHDPVLGWILKPSHTGYLVTGGRRIQYATNAFGYREANEKILPDFARPTIIFAGESVMDGYGLHWDEGIPAQVGQLTKLQTVDLSVGGYATDQIYLRLKNELPRFKRPVAVVFLFSPMLFRRNIGDGRPHLGPDLALHPADQRSKLMDIARWAIPYRSADETNRAISTTRAILSSAVRLAKSRGATPIVLVPQFEPENPAERMIRLRVLGNINLPVLFVPLNRRWHLQGDWHPDARAARVMAVAIADRLGTATPDKQALDAGSP